ncbi:MAG: hypothetical protein GKR90_18685 [Pseudomonadales bacterium]|nr:hypothetical protein [Pseudomonadales bacterium]
MNKVSRHIQAFFGFVLVLALTVFELAQALNVASDLGGHTNMIDSFLRMGLAQPHDQWRSVNVLHLNKVVTIAAVLSHSVIALCFAIGLLGDLGFKRAWGQLLIRVGLFAGLSYYLLFTFAIASYFRISISSGSDILIAYLAVFIFLSAPLSLFKEDTP